MAMTLKDALAQLKALGNEKVRTQNKKHGAGDNHGALVYLVAGQHGHYFRSLIAE